MQKIIIKIGNRIKKKRRLKHQKVLNTNYKQPINVKPIVELLKRFDNKISVAFKNAGDEEKGKSANYNLVFNEPKESSKEGNKDGKLTF